MDKNDSMLVDRVRDTSRMMTQAEAQATVEAAAEVLMTSGFISGPNVALLSRALTTLQTLRGAR